VAVELPLFCMAFFVVCAILLRSRVIGGTLIGLFLGALTMPDARPAVVLAILGAFVGSAIEGGRPKKEGRDHLTSGFAKYDIPKNNRDATPP
jgi:hypothetical protein